MELMIEAVAEAHHLTIAETYWLRRVVTGAVTGNRDRPLFLLAASVLGSGEEDLLALVLPRNGVLSRDRTALLDVLLTAALEDEAQTRRLIGALAVARRATDPVRALTADFSAVLNFYRSHALPGARHHNAFTAVRRFLLRHSPQDPMPHDGDGLRFWEAEATRDLLTRYSTALRALSDYAEAARLAETWRDVQSIDDQTVVAVSSDEAGMEGWDDPLAVPKLEDALSDIGKAPVKLLLTHERESLDALAGVADIVRVWPCDVLAALSLGPVQNAVIQALRLGGTVQSSKGFFAMARAFNDIQDRHSGLGESLMAALHLIRNTCSQASETGSTQSNTSLTLRMRIVAMEPSVPTRVRHLTV